MTIPEKAALLLQDLPLATGTDPVEIFHQMTQHSYIAMHGPEHHVLDGACLLVAYRNAGGDIDLVSALRQLVQEGIRMPGAMCGLWGVCGAVTSVGAALAILDETGPLSTDGSWGSHMAYTSVALKTLGAIDGPRCCKRDGMLALVEGIRYVNAHYPVHLELAPPQCIDTHRNAQCIGARCPFHP